MLREGLGVLLDLALTLPMKSVREVSFPVEFKTEHVCHILENNKPLEKLDLRHLKTFVPHSHQVYIPLVINFEK